MWTSCCLNDLLPWEQNGLSVLKDSRLVISIKASSTCIKTDQCLLTNHSHGFYTGIWSIITSLLTSRTATHTIQSHVSWTALVHNSTTKEERKRAFKQDPSKTYCMAIITSLCNYVMWFCQSSMYAQTFSQHSYQFFESKYLVHCSIWECG